MKQWTRGQWRGLSFLAVLGALVVVRAQFLSQPSIELAAQVGKSVVLVGHLVEEPVPSEASIRLVLLTAARERVVMSAPPFGHYGLGDKVEVRGTLARPKVFETASGMEFDYPDWLAVRGIFYKLDQPNLTTLTPAERYPVRRALLGVKTYFLGRLQAILPEPKASLLAGLLIGAQTPLGETLINEFRRTGLSHMVVLSGYNLTIVGQVIGAILTKLALSWRLGLSAGGLALFAAMAGGGASVARALLMALLALVARATGRLYAAGRALFAAGYLMTLWNPRLFLHDLGFQFSMLATFGLIYFSPLVERRLSRIPRLGGLKEVLVSTLAAQLAVLPWLLYKTGQLSLVAPLANPLVLVSVPPTMLLGAVAALLATLGPWLAFPVTALVSLLLSYQLWLVHLLAHLPGAAFAFARFPLWLALILYALIGWWYYRERRTRVL